MNNEYCVLIHPITPIIMTYRKDPTNSQKHESGALKRVSNTHMLRWEELVHPNRRSEG